MIKTMPDAEYFAIDALSNSFLSSFKKSDAHAKYYKDSGIEPTAAMRMGTLAHCMILEPAEFFTRYAVFPAQGCSWARKDGKQFKAEAIANGLIPIKLEEREAAQAMAEAVQAHPAAAHLLASGRPEVAMQWTDPESGLPCKAKADWLNEDRHILCDLKKTQDASPAGFAKTCAVYGYHRQAAFYSAGYEVLTGHKPVFVFIAVEELAPHATGVYMIDDDDLYSGDIETRRHINRYIECVKSGEWGGYGDDIGVIQLPTWAR